MSLADISVAVAESVTAGALSISLCSEPGASIYFRGGIVAYSVASKRDILGIDVTYAEKNNFANPFTALEMAKSVAKKLGARIGISTTGYSLPVHREAEDEKCALQIDTPYAVICLYDYERDYNEVIEVQYQKYSKTANQKIEKANAQACFTIAATKLFMKYIKNLAIAEESDWLDVQH